MGRSQRNVFEGSLKVLPELHMQPVCRFRVIHLLEM